MRPSFEGDYTTNWPSPMVVSTVTSSSLAQKAASRSGAVVSMTRYPIDAGTACPFLLAAGVLLEEAG